MDSFQSLFKKIEVIKEIENTFDEECFDFEKYEEKQTRSDDFDYDTFKNSLIYVKHNDKVDKLKLKYRDAVYDAYDLFKKTIPMILIDKIHYDKDIAELNLKYCHHRYNYHRNKFSRNPTDSRLISSALSGNIQCGED